MKHRLVPIAQVSLEIGVIVVDFGVIRHGSQSRTMATKCQMPSVVDINMEVLGYRHAKMITRKASSGNSIPHYGQVSWLARKWL